IGMPVSAARIQARAERARDNHSPPARRNIMPLHQTPAGVAVIEHDGALWQPTGDAEPPALQFTSDLAEYGWQPYAGTRDGLTVAAERPPGRRLPRLLATPEDLSE